MFDILGAFPARDLLAFTAGGILLNLAPGPDVLFATASGLSGGPRAGIMAGLGVGLGGLLHLTLAALGLAAVLAAHPGALDVIRWVGAGYLLFLAWQSWRSGGGDGTQSGAADPRRAILRGFLTNAFNPKPALFMLAFLPQFTDAARGPVWQQVVMLGLIFTFTGTLITAGYGALAGHAGATLARHRRLAGRVTALVFGGLALRLAAE